MERLIKHAQRTFSKASLAALSVNVLLGSVVSLPAFTPIAGAVGPTTTIVVKPSAMANWTITPSDGSVQGTFVAGPAVAPAGEGSLRETTGADGNQYVITHTTDFSGTPLSDITSFSYSTYVHDNQDSQAPYLSLRIDTNNDGIDDDRLYFEPVYQNGTYSMLNGAPAVPNQCGANPSCVTLDTWQTWNLQTGGWWSLNDSAGGPPLYTLASYVAAYPSARIMNGATGGIRIVAGAGAPSWNNFDGNVDMLTIGVSGSNTVYDFEPEIPPCSSTTFDSFTNGSVNGQGGWESTGPYDQAIVPNTYGYSTFGCKTLRLSNAVTSGAFGDQTFSVSNGNEAGETAATNGGKSGGTRQNHFEAQFDIASAVPGAQQTGLNLSVSPDRGDGSRMSYLRFDDNAGGIDVTFYDVSGTTDPTISFDPEVIATGLNRTIPHTVKFVMDFVDGPSNDIVKIYIDGALVHTGTSWENYYYYDDEASAEQSTRTVDSLLFRSSGTATPANSAKGFLFDNFNLAAGQTTSRVQIAKYVNDVHATAMNTSGATFNMTAVYSASNIGSGSDPYTISQTGNGTPEAYEARTIPLAYGASYSTYENTPAPCTAGYPFRLVGYTTGDTMTGAQMGIPSQTVPAFTNLSQNKYVIVWNETCPSMPVHVSPADGSTRTTAQMDKIDWSDVTSSPAQPITYEYEVAMSDTSTNPDGSFVNPVYGPVSLATSEILTPGTGDGVYHWHVRAVDGAGHAGMWTTPWTITINNAIPVVNFLGFRNQADGNYDNGQPILACGSTTASQFIAFEWQDVGTVPSVSYEYKILSGPTAVGYTQTHTDTHHNGGIPVAGTYMVQITPTDALGHTGAPVTCDMTYDPDFGSSSSMSSSASSESSSEMSSEASVSSSSSSASSEAVACTIEDSRLVGYWKLDEASSASTANDSAADNDGSVSGAMSAATPATTAFMNTGAYSFDGNNDSIDLGTNVGNFDLSDSFSVSAWINPALDFDNHAIYGNTWSNAGYLLRVTAENKLRFILVENGSIYNGMDSAVLTPGWHHVVGTWNGTDVKVYVDGVDASATPIANGTVTTITTAAHTFIGQTGEAGLEQYFDGSIDDVRVYSDALSVSEVAALGAGQCEGGTPTPHSSSSSSSSVSSVSSSSSSEEESSSSSSSEPVIVACTTTALNGYWPMNEGEGTTTFDTTGLGHDGTLQGGTAWASGAPQISPNPFGLAFDGSDDIVNITNSSDYNYGSQDFTVSTFVRSTVGNTSVLGNFSPAFKGWGLYIYNTNQVNFFGYGSMGSNDAAKPAMVLDGNWHNITGVYNRSGNNLTIDTYVDGILVGSNTAAVGDISANSTLYFGQYLPQPSLNGGMDDVRIYSRALSPSEIADIAGGCSNPVIVASSSSSSSFISEGGSSSSEAPVVTFGLPQTEESNSTNGSYRGSGTNRIGGAVGFLFKKIFGQTSGGVAPGGFGGGESVPFTDDEVQIICSLRKTLPADASASMVSWSASILASSLNRAEDQILNALKDPSFCPNDLQASVLQKVVAAPVDFRVSAAGYPISSNPTWNACITGKVTLQQIRSNPDRDKHNRGRDCGSYHTGNLWTHPDHNIFFTWNAKTKQITIPSDYALVKDIVKM